MKNYLFAFLLLLRIPVVGQQIIYKPFEVDTAAEPRGGMAYFNTYLLANLRKPISAEAQGVGGRVIVSAVAEPDGRLTEPKVTQSFRPDCDREALRVLTMFNAWKPAKKEGKAVRQIVTFPITFKPNRPFAFVNGARVSYYGEDMKLLPDSNELARYKQVTPLDTNGLPIGPIIVYQQKNRGWKEYNRSELVRRKDGQRSPSGQPTTLIGYLNNDKLWDGPAYNVDPAGKLVRTAFYENGRLAGTELTYHSNGMVARRKEFADKKQLITSWYLNGQIKQIGVLGSTEPTGVSTPETVTAFWDSTGNSLVKDGNGRVVQSELTQSYADTNRLTQHIEQGSFENGLKQGIWTGRYADGSYFYEEQYDKGICKNGKAIKTGGDTLRYTVRDQVPEFKGGMTALGNFLAQNLRYPDQAVRAKVQGRVFVTFVIDTDGGIQDVAIIKGIGFGCDEEAKRVVSRMDGKWTPGVQRGQPVRVKYNLPINFTFN